MIKHIVMWKFKEEAQGQGKAVNLQRAKDLLESCARLVAGTLKFEVAIARPDMECTYDLVLYSEFSDRATLDAYQMHPEHGAIKPFFGAVRLERQCMDYEV